MGNRPRMAIRWAGSLPRFPLRLRLVGADVIATCLYCGKPIRAKEPGAIGARDDGKALHLRCRTKARMAEESEESKRSLDLDRDDPDTESLRLDLDDEE